MSDIISDASDSEPLLEAPPGQLPMIDDMETKEEEDGKTEEPSHRLSELNSMPLVRFAPRKAKHKLIVLPTFSLRGRSLWALADPENRHLALQNVTLQNAGPVSIAAIADSIVPSQHKGRDVLITALSKARLIDRSFILLPVAQSFALTSKLRLVEDGTSSLPPRLHRVVIGEMKYQRGKVFSFVINAVIGILIAAIGLKAPGLMRKAKRAKTGAQNDAFNLNSDLLALGSSSLHEGVEEDAVVLG